MHLVCSSESIIVQEQQSNVQCHHTVIVEQNLNLLSSTAFRIHFFHVFCSLSPRLLAALLSSLPRKKKKNKAKRDAWFRLLYGRRQQNADQYENASEWRKNCWQIRKKKEWGVAALMLLLCIYFLPFKYYVDYTNTSNPPLRPVCHCSPASKIYTFPSSFRRARFIVLEILKGFKVYLSLRTYCLPFLDSTTNFTGRYFFFYRLSCLHVCIYEVDIVKQRQAYSWRENKKKSREETMPRRRHWKFVSV